MRRTTFRRVLSLIWSVVWLWVLCTVLTVAYLVLAESCSLWDTYAAMIQTAPISFTFILSVLAVSRAVDLLIK